MSRQDQHVAPSASSESEPEGPAWLDDYRALREGCGLAAFDWRTRIRLTGEDRSRFLNGQMTCDLRRPEAGTGVYGFFTSAKGRVESDAVALFGEDRIDLELPTGTAEAIAERLRKYIIVDRVEVSARAEEAGLLFAGPQAHRWVEADGGVLPQEAWQHAAGHCRGRSGHVVREGGLGAEAYSFWLPKQEAADLFAELKKEGSRPVTGDALEALRLEDGLPRFGDDFGPENLPQETGLDFAVSYQKGCYLGQEVVARLHYRGQVSRQLRRLVAVDKGQAVPAAGTNLLFEERSAGLVTSATWSPRQERPIAFALIQRRAFEPGTVVEAEDGGTFEVHPLSADQDG